MVRRTLGSAGVLLLRKARGPPPSLAGVSATRGSARADSGLTGDVPESCFHTRAFGNVIPSPLGETSPVFPWSSLRSLRRGLTGTDRDRPARRVGRYAAGVLGNRG